MIPVRSETAEPGTLPTSGFRHFRNFRTCSIWGDRVFAYHTLMSIDGEPCRASYREVFAYCVGPQA